MVILISSLKKAKNSQNEWEAELPEESTIIAQVINETQQKILKRGKAVKPEEIRTMKRSHVIKNIKKAKAQIPFNLSENRPIPAVMPEKVLPHITSVSKDDLLNQKEQIK